jgi:UDP-glucuronate decarboxylase
MVIGIDNLSTGSIENLSGALTNQNFRFLEMDVTTPYSFDVDLILNFACPASPVHYQLTPIETLKTSILGTLNALELCRETGARLVQASTSEVYGDPDVSPQKEDYVGRVNTYGPRMAIDDGRVVSNFLVAALNGDPITIYGDGLQTRSFCYVSDTISGAIAIASTSERPISPVNIGNPHEMTMLELAQQSLRLTSSTSLLEFHELPIDDPKQRCPDISLAKGILEWYPKVELIEGLTQTADYFRRVLGK